MQKQHQQLKKGTKRKANAVTVSQLTRSAAAGQFNPVNIWTLGDTYQFLLAINGTTERYPVDQIDKLRNDGGFNEYLLTVTMAKLDEMHNAPSYEQIKYSKSSFSALCQTTQIVFRIYINKLIKLLDEEKLKLACLSVECLKKCLCTADFLYKRKFSEFQKLIGRHKILAANFHYQLIYTLIFRLGNGSIHKHSQARRRIGRRRV